MNAQEEVWHDGQAKGYKKGYKRGQLEEARRLTLNMLKENTKIPYIAKVTGLSEREIKKMKNGS